MINYERITLEELKNPERFTDNTDFLKDAVAYAVGKTTEIRGEYVHNYPTANSENLMYGKLTNSVEDVGGDWIPGFWTGMLWLSYELGMRFSGRSQRPSLTTISSAATSREEFRTMT